MKTTIYTSSTAETQKFAQFLAQKLQGHELIFLEGPLGAGKTTFTQGIAQGLNITQKVNSPTFTIMKLYSGDHDLIHIDAYRLEGLDQDLGFEEYLDHQGIMIVEWPQYIQEHLPKPDLHIQLEYLDENLRQLHLDGSPELMAEVETYER